MKKSLIAAGASVFLAAGFLSTSAIAGAYGTWKRPNGSTVKVWKCGGKMCAKVTAGKGAGFTMFRGLKSAGKNLWKGNMKHPKMGNLFTFNGTVKYRGGTMSVKGCMIGGSFCDAETWRKR
jgi:uncharacterized protein (DUF2147 family)